MGNLQSGSGNQEGSGNKGGDWPSASNLYAFYSSKSNSLKDDDYKEQERKREKPVYVETKFDLNK